MRVEKPLDEKQLKEGNLIPPGIYDFEVLSVEDMVSKKTNKDMIKLLLKIYLPDGSTKNVFDYLIESLAWKLGHFAQAVGLYEKYQCDQTLTEDDCLRKCGQVKIFIQKDKTGEYPDKNAVADYIPTDEAQAAKMEAKVAAAKAAAPANDGFSDEIPF